MQSITIHAPAKVNLALEVCGLLPGGFHDLDMIMQAVTLYETIRLEKRPAGELTLECRAADGTLAADIPTDARNLAWRAARLFLDAAGIADGVFVSVTKAVPSQAGMAGGSADAAGVLVGLDLLFETGMTVPQLCALGEQLGSDVPFCIVGGTARVQGRGERVAPIAPLPACHLVAVMPHTGSSTPEGFARYDKYGSPFHPDVDACAAALAAGDLAALCQNAGNALQTACATQETAVILEKLNAHGAAAALLTGTGAVTYGIFTDAAAANVAAEELRNTFAPVFVLAPEARGPHAVTCE